MRRYILGLVLAVIFAGGSISAQTLQNSGAVGVEGTIPSAPPSQAPTIATPTNGQAFSTLPISVSGLCQNDLLVEVFKNGVFSGSATCSGGSYALQIDLFSGRNDLIARQYDDLNQASPDSNTVTITFNDSLPSTGPRISLTTAYAKRGATPGETLGWPITISGGTPPFALSIDWGDKSVQDLLSQQSPGDILLKHVYNQSGVYNITIKASDTGGQVAFLQVVGIGNGPIQQTEQTTPSPSVDNGVSNRAIIYASAIAIPLFLTSFWLGKKHQLQLIRSRIRKGQRPF